MSLPGKEFVSDGPFLFEEGYLFMEVKSGPSGLVGPMARQTMSSLVKSPQMSPAKVAANQANSLHSTGPITPDGLERVRVGKLRHGLCASDPRDLLAFLGEDPDEFERYEQALFQKWQPSDAFEEALVRRIAHNSWRVDRAARIQEHTMALEVVRLEGDRAIKAENHARRMQGILSALQELLEMNRKGGFTDFEAVMSAYNGVYGPHPSARGNDIFNLMYKLSPALQIGSNQVKPEQAMVPPPNERARINIRLTELLEAEMDEVRRYDETYRWQHIEITPAERQARLGPVQPHAPAIIRLEESLAHRLERDVRLLLHLKDRDVRAAGTQGNAALSHEGRLPKPTEAAPGSAE